MGGTILEFSNDKIYNEGKAEGFNEGFTEGKNEGSRKTKQILRTLYPKLIAAGRTADFEKCMNDDVFLDQLCKEFQIA